MELLFRFGQLVRSALLLFHERAGVHCFGGVPVSDNLHATGSVVLKE